MGAAVSVLLALIARIDFLSISSKINFDCAQKLYIGLRKNIRQMESDLFVFEI